MCGIAGVAYPDPRGVDLDMLTRMAAAIRHRGPDGFGFYRGSQVGLAHVRLSIIDVARGAQPMLNEDGSLIIVYNGEVYNYVELQRELEARGHRFRTHCDTEVILHGFEEWGEHLLDRLIGQFAFAIYDRRRERLTLARDRFGVRPLFFAEHGGALYFGSEVKALFASGKVPREPDARGLDQVFTFWAARPPRTVFAGVYSLEPGCIATWDGVRLATRRYYSLDYPEERTERPSAMAELDALLRDAVRLRMRADVPVGGYLSGGLDSSITATLAAHLSPYALRTFSVTFADPQFDERRFQEDVARRIGSQHQVQHIGETEIAEAFPEVIRHVETPLLRTAPVPMFLLARQTREQGIKVVLTGEGADELFLGYDLFKEVIVREFCLRQPTSTVRPRLFDRLYPYLGSAGRGGDFWRSFFLSVGAPNDPLFSHLPRFLLTSRIKEFLGPALRETMQPFDALAELRDELPQGFSEWSSLGRAAYLEMVTLLSPYLLSSQGDRVSMAFGVEGRFPFLDHRLYEFASALPSRSKLRGLEEKSILRRWAEGIVPPAVLARSKQPYRAPDAAAFFGSRVPDYVEAALAEATQSGYFDVAAVSGLLRRCRQGRALGARENQALVAVLSTQLWLQAFITDPPTVAPLASDDADVFLTDAVLSPFSTEAS